MKIKLIVISFSIIISIFLFNYTITQKICDKKVLVLGSIISIKNENINNFKEEERTKIVNTSKQNIGIITCIDKQTNEYVAFCHQINSNDQELENNTCYKADYVSVEKSQTNKIGKLNAQTNSKFEIGNITQNSQIGVFGKVTDLSIFNNDETIELNIGSRYAVKKGKAQIYVNLEGKGLEKYDIYLENINYFDETKNIHVKVIDEKLIEKTGGIIKGMSGSPIIQNNKLIGAINCALEKDSTDAYAIFADKLFKKRAFTALFA